MPVSVSRRSLLKASGLTAAAVSVNGAASAVASAATKDINVQHPIRNIEHIRAFYKNFPTRLAAVRKGFNVRSRFLKRSSTRISITSRMRGTSSADTNSRISVRISS